METKKTSKIDTISKAEKTNKMDIKKMAVLAMFSVIALTIFTVESMIGPIVPIPGIKLGLANIITLLVLVLYGPKEAVFVLIVRILLGSMFGGQMISFFYSLSGGVLCWLVMSLINMLLKNQFLVLTSMCGAAAHNIGQIFAAIVITQSISVVAYLPILMISAMITGCFTGLAAQVSAKRLQKILKMYF
jgi:heptaprenyl diphosphate synthase